jgi:hypothetical protein
MHFARPCPSLPDMNACVFSTMLYGYEAWMPQDAKRRLLSFERKCYVKILKTGWIQEATNEV